ncbi:ornithine decarboxylase [Streptomyces albaduncus]|uniref:ornithine decarboxylase n=1 Tax=Streptomyces griseoloalbus TaxID=67303 RepID=A0A7W8BLZ3_9ACTN|nr:ornithine decarboxylase [Streptomyces albaduncus]GGW39476.1 ornithine decarboxylase [Streptomyces albaduncus]
MRAALRAALAASAEDALVYDLDGIADRYDALAGELPGVDVRFAMKACPVQEVLACLAGRGSGFDAASPREVARALATGVPARRIHYGNTVKSDRNIAHAYRLGVRDFATDSVEDVAALAEHAPGARVFCRLATSGEGALWGLSRKFGCSVDDAVRVLEAARDAGLVPSGLSVHVGSQQMTTEAWQQAFAILAAALTALHGRGIVPDHVNLGGGLPALGYVDRRGKRLEPPLDKTFAVLREGMERLAGLSPRPLDFLLEPGRHLVADHGAVRAHVSRLTSRRQPDGEREHWLYLSCGKFNGLYEMDEVQYPLVFPSHPDAAGADLVPAVVAGPTCDSDDAYAHEHRRVLVPKGVASGDPVWVLSAGAYAASYTTEGFNGFDPLPHVCVRGDAPDVRIRAVTEDDWPRIAALEAEVYAPASLSEGVEALRSRGRASPSTCFVLETGGRIAGYVLALPYPRFRYPDLTRPEERAFDSRNLHLHDLVIADDLRGRGLGSRLLEHLTVTAGRSSYERISLIAVGGTESFWAGHGYRPDQGAELSGGYGDGAVYMSCPVQYHRHGGPEEGS